MEVINPMTNKGILMCENIRELLNDELTNFNDCVLVKTILSSFNNIRKDIKDTLDIDLRSCLSFKIGFDIVFSLYSLNMYYIIYYREN